MQTNRIYYLRVEQTPPDRLFAVASPRSFWQCVEKMTFSAPGVFFRRSAIMAPNSCGSVQPTCFYGSLRLLSGINADKSRFDFWRTVSGMLSVVAPASMTAPRMRYRKANSDRPASSGLHSKLLLLKRGSYFQHWDLICVRLEVGGPELNVIAANALQVAHCPHRRLQHLSMQAFVTKND